MPTQDWKDKVNFRCVRKSDLPLLEWEGEYQHLRNVYKNAYEKSKTGKTKLWIAEIVNFGLVGQVFVQVLSSRLDLANGIDRAYLYAFRIKEKYRNVGLGSSFLSFIETDLITNNFKEVTLNVSRGNYKAIHFYEKRGFKIVSEESGEWTYRDHNNVIQHVIEPAWKMVKFL